MSMDTRGAPLRTYMGRGAEPQHDDGRVAPSRQPHPVRPLRRVEVRAVHVRSAASPQYDTYSTLDSNATFQDVLGAPLEAERCEVALVEG